MQSVCDSCKQPKAIWACGVCQSLLCKKCVQRVAENPFLYMETVPEGERLPARVALNSYSWTETFENEETGGSTYFVPYTVTVIYPQDGPVTGGTDILIQGVGFVQND